MNAPANITTDDDYRARARRIVDRALPSLRVVNPLYAPAEFAAGSRREGERQRLFWRTFARLRAKAEGGAPYLTLPKDTYVLEGGAMWEVAQEFERLADGELMAIRNDHKRFERRGL